MFLPELKGVSEGEIYIRRQERIFWPRSVLTSVIVPRSMILTHVRSGGKSSPKRTLSEKVSCPVQSLHTAK